MDWKRSSECRRISLCRVWNRSDETVKLDAPFAPIIATFTSLLYVVVPSSEVFPVFLFPS